MKNLSLSWSDEIGTSSYQRIWEQARMAARRAINQMDIRSLYDFQKSKSGNYCCPCCGSGTGPHKTGALQISKNGRHITCYNPTCSLSGSGKGHDVLGALRYLLSADESSIFDRFLPDWRPFHGQAGPDGSGSVAAVPVQPVIKAQPEEELNQEKAYIQDWTEYFQACAARIQETEYHRGISLETLQAYQIGYDPAWQHPKHIWEKEHGQRQKMPPATPHLIIPTSDRSYLARYTGDSSTLPEAAQWMVKIKVGSIHLFNGDVIRNDSIVFVTEGEINALSIIDCGFDAVAIGSASRTADFIETVKAAAADGFCGACIITMDPDQAGQTAAEILMQGLQQIPGISVLDATMALCSDGNDINDELIQDRAGLAARLKDLHQAAQDLILARKETAAADPDPDPVGDPGQQASTDPEPGLSLSVDQDPEQAESGGSAAEQEAYEQNNEYNTIEGFWGAISDMANTPVTPTGFPCLDRLLDGGLYEGVYVIGAISSLGKTTFVMQIADQIAAGGQDVLIISLEMSRYELLSKSISRQTLMIARNEFGNVNLAKTSRGISDGRRYKRYSEKELDVINKAMQICKETGKHKYVIEGVGNVSVLNVMQAIDKHIRLTGRKPVVIIDYLQILQSLNDHYSDKQNTDKNMTMLKQISRDRKLTIIAISSFNRDNYSEAVNMSAFKESGAIEYSSDVLLGMQLKGAGTKGFDVDLAKQKYPREVELKILKNRQGATGKLIDFNYYPLFNCFEERGEGRHE